MSSLEVVFVICELMDEEEAKEYSGNWSGNNAICFINETPVFAYFSQDDESWYTTNGYPVPDGAKKYKLVSKA